MEKLHLENKEKRAEMNLDFVKFFSNKRDIGSHRNIFGHLEKWNEPLRHKDMIKNMIEVFEVPVSQINEWFKEAMTEVDNDVIRKNYEDFRKKYLNEKIDPFVEKMNKHKPMIGQKLYRYICDNYSVLYLGSVLVSYHKIEGFIESYPEEMKDKLNKSTDRIFNEFYKIYYEYHIESKILKSIDYLRIGEKLYNIKRVSKWLDYKHPMMICESGMKSGKINICQNDRKIILINTNIIPEENALIVNIEDIGKKTYV